MDSIILLGAGGHAASCIDVIESQNKYKVFGLLAEKPGTDLSNRYPILGSDAKLGELLEHTRNVLVAVGQIETADLRRSLYGSALSMGAEFPIICAVFSYVSRVADIGDGTIVMNGAVVNARAAIGVNSIINSCALIEHDVVVGDHCHISTGALINGGVKIGHGSFIGSGAVLREGVVIGDDKFIKAGQIVGKDIL